MSKIRLSTVQRAAYRAYPTEFLPLPDLTTTRVSQRQIDTCGDGLFAFIINELSVVDDADFDDALRLITEARLALQNIERALFNQGKPTT